LNVLLDESVSHVVKERLSHLVIRTVQDMGWTGIKNDELLGRAEEQFEVFVTADQNLRYQQNLSSRKLAFVVLPTNQVRAVVGLFPALENALKVVRPGALIEIPLPA
jgi:hypothetical protein